MTRTGAPAARPATEETRPVRRGLRRTLAALATLALGAGLAVVGAAAPASAHTGDLHANAVCNAETGEYDVTYTLTLANVPKGYEGGTRWRVGGAKFEKTPTSAAGMDRGPISSSGNTTITLGTVSLPGDTKGAGPWVYAFTRWTPDAYGYGSDGRVEGLKGDCGDGDGKKLTICHATESDEKNPYNRITIPYQAVLNTHYGKHQWGEDIIPEFTYQGKTYPARGDVSLLQYEDCQKPFDWNWEYAAPTCEALTVVYPGNIPAGQANDVNIRIVADGKTITLNFHNNDGTWSGTKLFRYADHPDWPAPNTWTVQWVQVGGTNYHWTGSVSCGEEKQIPIPAQPEKQDLCGIGSDRVLDPAVSEGVIWSISPVVEGAATATATAKPGYVFVGGDKIARWDFTFTNEPCETKIETPVAPKVIDQCGVDGDSVVQPEPTTGVRWEISAIVDGHATATAYAESGYTFADGAKQVSYPLSFDTTPCPPEKLAIAAAPTAVDQCGTEGDRVVITEQPNVTWSQQGAPASGTVVVTATAAEGYVFSADGDFPGGPERSFELHFDTEPCPTVVERPVAPKIVDLCGTDRDEIVTPEPVTGVRWEIGEIVDGSATVTAYAEQGFAFADGATQIVFPLAFDQTECETPTLFGSTAAAVCEANTPWIVFDVVLNDPDGISTGHTAYLVLSDGTHTEKVELGPLGEDGMIEGRVLWPGAAIDEAGNPIAWPGWKQLPNGRWVVTDENFGWTHSLTSATLEVNPELSIALEYPPAVVGCGPASSPASSGDPTPIASGEGSGLASTGFAGGPLLYVAGGLVLLGAVVLAVTIVVRRKRA